MFLTF